MPVLNLVRCIACPEELEAENYNSMIWRAQDEGWVVDEDRFICPRHQSDPDVTTKLPGPGLKWEASCSNCEWEEEFWTEEDAKAEKKRHDCDDWRTNDWPDVTIRSPQEILESKQRQEEYREKRLAQLRVEAQEKRAQWEAYADLLTELHERRQPWWRRWFG